MRAASKIAQSLVSLGLALAIALPPSAAALADEPAKVALAPIVPLFGNLPGSPSPATADKLTELLAQELKKQEGLSLVPLAGAPKPAAAPAKHAVDDEGGGDSAGDAAPPFQGAGERGYTRALASVAKGKKDMQRLRFDAAASELKEGISGIEGSFDLLSDYGVLVDAYLQLAIADLRIDQRDAGQQALATVVRLAPEQNLTGNYPAVFVRMFNGLRQQLTQGTKGTVEATSTPAGQLVKVDGRDAGVTPVSLELIPGPHFIVVSGDGGKLFYKVNAQPGSPVRVGNGEAPQRQPIAKSAPVPEPKPSSKPEPSPKAVPLKVEESPLQKLTAEIEKNNIDDRGGEALAKLADGAFVVFGGIHFLDEDQTELALDTMLFSPSANEVAALTQVQFDAELTGAPAELAKVAAEVAQHVAKWSDEVGLPQPVAPGVKAPKAPKPRLVGVREARKPAKPDDEGLPAGHARRLEAQEGTDLGPSAELGPEGGVAKSHERGSFPWLPVGIGVGAAVVVAVGVTLLVVALDKKPGVNTQVGW